MTHLPKVGHSVQRSLTTLLLACFLLLPLAANAGSIEGKMNGIHCATNGEVCPIDRLDPHLALEEDFVVQQANGDYYLIVNLDRAVKARYVLDDVRVTGNVNTRYRAIDAETLEVKQDGAYKTVWTDAMQRREYEGRTLPGTTPRP